jgi:hypothetical protein
MVSTKPSRNGPLGVNSLPEKLLQSKCMVRTIAHFWMLRSD